MALTDAKIRAAKHTDKAYKLTDGAGMFLLVQPGKHHYSSGWSHPVRSG